MKKIPDALIIAVAKYYHARSLENKAKAKLALEDLKWYLGGTKTWSSADKIPVFDKEACLKHIGDVAKKHNLGWLAVAGTFWFTNSKGKSLEVNESNYLVGGTKTLEKKKSP